VEKAAAGNIVRVIRSDPSQTGQTLRLAMDIRLQKEADRLMGNRRGALVAIDPQTGGVLAFVSKPNFDPNVFIDGIDSDTWKSLNEDWQRPLINRVTQGMYPPGSTFKPFMAMTLLESGKIGQGTYVPAPGAWSIPGTKHQFRDAARGGHGSVTLLRAIQMSSDTFFYRLGYELGIEKAFPYLASFGFGERAVDAFNQRLFQMVFRLGKRRACQQAECGNKGDKGLALHSVSFRLWQPAQRSGVAKLKRARVILLRFIV